MALLVSLLSIVCSLSLSENTYCYVMNRNLGWKCSSLMSIMNLNLQWASAAKMGIENIWNKVSHEVTHEVVECYDKVVDAYHKAVAGYEKTVDGVKERIQKFELDNNLKGPPVHPDLPYIEIGGDGLDNLIKKPGNYSETIDVDGTPRHFILHVPTGYDASPKGVPIPLVVALHGFTQNATEFEVYSGLDKDADKKDVAVLYPDAKKWFNIDIAAAWYTGNGLTPFGKKVNDVGFIRKAIDTAENQIKVDRNRVNLMGVSNGGMEAYKVATKLSGRIAAVVDISGAMSGSEVKPPYPVSVMSIVGTKDEIVPADGRTKAEEVSVINKEVLQLISAMVPKKWQDFFASKKGQELGKFVVETSDYAPTFKPVSYTTDFWKSVDHIDAQPVHKIAGKVVSDYYTNPKTGVSVEQVVVTGMDHAAQSGVPSSYKINDEAWAFLSAHPKYPPKK
jgi:poly(3-hydroxybutyrate) depolymerase